MLERTRHVVCSAGLADCVHERCPEVQVSEWCYPAQAERADAVRVEELRRYLRIPSRHRVLLYCGNFASYQGLELLVDAFRLARQRDAQLSLVCVGGTESEMSDPTREGLAETIVKTFASPLEARAAGQRALRYAAQHLNWGQFVRLIKGVYHDVPLSGPLVQRSFAADTGPTFH